MEGNYLRTVTKKGDLTNPSNWRPVAVLRVCYKVFARLIHNRIRPGLERHQSDDQMGFRPQRSTEDALLILESVISNSFEYNVPLWFASLDLKRHSTK